MTRLFWQKLKDHPHVVFDCKAPERREFAGKLVGAQHAIVEGQRQKIPSAVRIFRLIPFGPSIPLLNARRKDALKAIPVMGPGQRFLQDSRSKEGKTISICEFQLFPGWRHSTASPGGASRTKARSSRNLSSSFSATEQVRTCLDQHFKSAAIGVF